MDKEFNQININSDYDSFGIAKREGKEMFSSFVKKSRRNSDPSSCSNFNSVEVETQTSTETLDSSTQTDPSAQPPAFILVPANSASVSQIATLSSGSTPVGYQIQLANFMPSNSQVVYPQMQMLSYPQYSIAPSYSDAGKFEYAFKQSQNFEENLNNEIVYKSTTPTLSCTSTNKISCDNEILAAEATLQMKMQKDPIFENKFPGNASSSSEENHIDVVKEEISNHKKSAAILSLTNKEKYNKLKKEDPVKYRFTNIRSAVGNEITNKNLDYTAALESAMEKLYAPKKTTTKLSPEQLLEVDKLLEKWLSKKFGVKISNLKKPIGGGSVIRSDNHEVFVHEGKENSPKFN